MDMDDEEMVTAIKCICFICGGHKVAVHSCKKDGQGSCRDFDHFYRCCSEEEAMKKLEAQFQK